MNVGFVSGRLAGTDGVSLETHKWAEVMEGMGHTAFYCAGELEEDGPPGLLVPEMYFHTEEADWIVDHAYGTTDEHPELRPRVRRLADFIKERLYAFIAQYGIDLLVPENALTIPIQISLAIALAEGDRGDWHPRHRSSPRLLLGARCLSDELHPGHPGPLLSTPAAVGPTHGDQLARTARSQDSVWTGRGGGAERV
jgi:hypothetical protein